MIERYASIHLGKPGISCGHGTVLDCMPRAVNGHACTLVVKHTQRHAAWAIAQVAFRIADSAALILQATAGSMAMHAMLI